MAIYSLNSKLVSRSKGQSLVGQTAYITRSTMVDQRTGVSHSFSEKYTDSIKETPVLNESISKENTAIDLIDNHRNKEQVISNVMLPEGAPNKLQNPEFLANAIELFEDSIADKRFRIHQNDIEKARKSALAKEQFLNTAQTAQSLIIALRRGASIEQQKESVETFIEEVFKSRGLPSVYSMHIDDHNPHVHIKVGRRAIIEGEFSEFKDRWIVSKEGLMHIRSKWAEVDNMVARSHGDLEVIDYRSHEDRGLKISPTKHEGWYSKYIQSVGDTSRIERENNGIQLENIEKVVLDPGELLKSVCHEHSLFTRSQFSQSLLSKFESDSTFQELHKKLTGLGEEYKFKASDLEAMASYWSDRCLKTDGIYRAGHSYNGHELFGIKASKAFEAGIVSQIKGLNSPREYGRWFNRLIENPEIEKKISEFNKASDFSLNQEQIDAIHNLCGKGNSIRILNGAAGTGKSKVLSPVSDLYRVKGHQVWGASFQASVVNLLKEDIGENCHTLDYLRIGWKEGFVKFSKKDVLIIDEAGMISSDLYQDVFKEIKKSGATLILVGDTKQILSRGGFDTFRTVKSLVGSSDLKQVVRQKEEWMRDASMHFANHDVEKGLSPYAKAGNLTFHEKENHLYEAVTKDVLDQIDSGVSLKDILVSAHKNVTVNHLNESIRKGLIKRGLLKSEVDFKHRENKKPFAIGDRIMFTKNDNQGRHVRNASWFDSESGIKNNNQGEIIEYNHFTKQARVKLDDGRKVKFSARNYTDYTYALAKTTNRTQGVTSDKHYFVIDGASSANKLYVGLTRHKEGVHVHVDAGYAKNFEELCFKVGRGEIKYSSVDHDLIDEKYHKYVAHYIDLKEQLKDAYSSETRPDDLIKNIESEMQQFADGLIKIWDKVEPLCLVHGIRLSHLKIATGERSGFIYIEQIDQVRADLIDHYVLADGFEKVTLGYRLQLHLDLEPINKHTFSALKENAIGGKDLKFSQMLYEEKAFAPDKKGEVFESYLSYQNHARDIAKNSRGLQSLERQKFLQVFNNVLEHVSEQQGIKLRLIDFHEFKLNEDPKLFNPNHLNWYQLKAIGHELDHLYGKGLCAKKYQSFFESLKEIGSKDDSLESIKNNRIQSAHNFKTLIGKEHLLKHFGEKFGDKVLKDSDHQCFKNELRSFYDSDSVSDRIKRAQSIENMFSDNPRAYALDLKNRGSYTREHIRLFCSLESFEKPSEAMSHIDNYIGKKEAFRSYCALLKPEGYTEVTKAEVGYETGMHFFGKELKGCISELDEEHHTGFRRSAYLSLREYAECFKKSKFDGAPYDHMVKFFKEEFGEHSFSGVRPYFDRMYEYFGMVHKLETHLNEVSKSFDKQVFDSKLLHERNKAANDLLSEPFFKTHLEQQDKTALKVIEKIADNMKKSSVVNHTNDLSNNTKGAPSYKNSIDVNEVKSRIEDSAKEIAIHLLGSQNQKLSTSRQLRFGNKGSLSVNISGSKSGMWYDFETGESGHLFNLVQKYHNYSFKETLEHFGDQLGLNRYTDHSKTRLKKNNAKVTQEEQKDLEKKQLKVNKILEGSKSLKGSIAERYLQNRGIDTTHLGEGLKFHPGIYDYGTKKKHPALVCVGKDEDGNVKSVQVVHLNNKGEKASVDVVKRTQGLMRGSFVEVQKGNFEKDKKLFIAEGPETAASIANARKDSTVLACLGISNFKNLPQKYKDHEIVICADHDDPLKKQQAILQVQKSFDYLKSQGFKVSVVKPERVGHDFNDVLKHEGIKQVNHQLNAEQEHLHQHIQQVNIGRGR